MKSQPEKQHEVTLNDIKTGLPAVKEVTQKGDLDKKEEIEVDSARLKNDLVRAHIESLSADRKMRETYARRILKYLERYTIGVGLMVVASGWAWTYFSLPTEILATLVGSTAVAAIGLVGFIARGLFRPPPDLGE